MPHHVLHVFTVSLMFCQDDEAMRMRKRTTSDDDLPDMPGELLSSQLRVMQHESF